MGTITALTIQKKNPERVNVFIDDEFAFGTAAITAVSLKVGQTLTPAEIDEIQLSDQLETAKQSAIRFIGYRPRSIAEVRRNLQRKGYDEAVVEEAIARLQAVELLDDVTFANYWIEQREAFKPRSRLALRQELQQKGVSREVIDAALEDVDESAAARRAAEKQMRRWQSLPQKEFEMKLLGYLQRRGFSYYLNKEIAAEMWEVISADKQNE